MRVAAPASILPDTAMLKNRHREKQIECIVYFAAHTQHCGKIKLIKLLYLLDFAHFRQTGRSVTGLDYAAWRMGPVPQDLFGEWDEPRPDWMEAVDIVPTKIIDHTRDAVVAKRAFSDAHFSRRELALMKDVADRHHNDFAKQMVDVTHRGGPWSIIWDGGRGQYEHIPYALAVASDDVHREAVLEAASEYAAMTSAATTALH